MENYINHLNKQGKLYTRPPFGWKKDLNYAIKSYKGTNTYETVEVPEEQAVISFVRDLVKDNPDINCSQVAKLVNEAVFDNRLKILQRFNPTQINRIANNNNIPIKKKAYKSQK